MTHTIPLTREQVITLMTTHIQNTGLQKHCLAVGLAMRALAEHFHEDEELWGLIGLLHDADWEDCKDAPHTHTSKTVAWLEELGCKNNAITEAILTHAHHVNGYHRQPENNLEWSLFCCDELTGLIVANALVMPSRKLVDVTVESVIKKMGSKSFAAAVDRTGIQLCEEKLGIPLADFITIVLKGMQKHAVTLGL